jgi:hypothetical protein
MGGVGKLRLGTENQPSLANNGEVVSTFEVSGQGGDGFLIVDPNF